MRDIYEVLREKEEELAKLTQEVDALRLVARLLTADGSDKNRSAPAVDRSREPVMPQRIKDFP